MRIFLIKPNAWDLQVFLLWGAYLVPGVLCTRFSLGVLGDLLLQRLYYTRLYLVLTGFFLFIFSFFNCCKVHGWSNLEEIYWAHSLIEHSRGKEVALGATFYCGPGSLLTLCSSGKWGLRYKPQSWLSQPPACPNTRVCPGVQVIYGAGCFPCKAWSLKVNILLRV